MCGVEVRAKRAGAVLLAGVERDTVVGAARQFGRLPATFVATVFTVVVVGHE